MLVNKTISLEAVTENKNDSFSNPTPSGKAVP